MKRMASAVTGAFCLALAISNANAAHHVSAEGLWSYDEDVLVPTPLDPEDSSNSDLMNLPANVFVPTTTTAGQKFPAIIFINSWVLEEHEYTSVAKALADKGYIVFSYTTRGWWSVPGFIDTAGNKDVKDAGNVISYLINNYPVEPTKIALGGTSYGSGISLNTATQDDRVAAVIATSTWGSLVESLWPNQTPQKSWVNLLINTSQRPIGREDPEIAENLQNMHEHKNVDATIAWGMERSPINYIDQVNAREHKPAIFVGNNLHDYLFHPNSIVKFLQAYQGPWHVDFSFGVHGAGEASGLMGKEDSSYMWNNAFAWLDHYLKGESNYIDQVDKVTTMVKSTTGDMRDSFPSFPVNDSVVTMYADPVAGQKGGELNTTGTINADSPVIDSEYDVVWTGGIVGAQQMSGHFYKLQDIDDRGAIVFKSPVLTENMYLRGAPFLKFSAYVKHNLQYFGYLLDYDPVTDIAYWVGHGPFTWHRPEGTTEDPTEPVEITMEMFWTAHDIAAGHQLILVVDGADPDYFLYADSATEHQFVIDSAHPMSVELPVISSRKVADSIERREAIAAAEAAKAQDEDNSRSSNGSGTSYGPGGGSFDFGVFGLALLGLRSLRRVRIK